MTYRHTHRQDCDLNTFTYDTYTVTYRAEEKRRHYYRQSSTHTGLYTSEQRGCGFRVFVKVSA